jgi:group I intron endonuclease
MIYIYVLENKGYPVYIGKTINPQQRFKDHKKTKQIDDYFIIDEVNEDEWVFWEKHYISLFKSWGYNLLNENEGGGGCKIGTKFSQPRTKEHSNKISQRKKGIPIHTEEQKQKWSKERKGKPTNYPKIVKHKPHKSFNKTKPHSNKGIPLTEEHKQKCAEGKHKSVLIYDKNNNLIKECQSIEETALFLQCSKGNVSQNLKEKTKTCKGYILKYK